MSHRVFPNEDAVRQYSEEEVVARDLLPFCVGARPGKASRASFCLFVRCPRKSRQKKKGIVCSRDSKSGSHLYPSEQLKLLSRRESAIFPIVGLNSIAAVTLCRCDDARGQFNIAEKENNLTSMSSNKNLTRPLFSKLQKGSPV